VPARTTAVFVAKRSVADQADLLIGQIEDLVAAGVLNQGQGNALIVKLQNAIAKFAKGNAKAAASQLQAFINQVEDFVADGILTAEQGVALIMAAEDIVATIGA
jgi:hypothetical protein